MPIQAPAAPNMPKLACYGSIRDRVGHWALAQQTTDLLLSGLQRDGFDINAAPTLDFYNLTEERIQGYGIAGGYQDELVFSRKGLSTCTRTLDGNQEVMHLSLTGWMPS